MKNHKRNNFTVIFDRYENDKLYKVKLHLKDIKNEHGAIIKFRYWLKPKDAKDILGMLMHNEEIAFTAILEVTPDYADGFKLFDPIVLKYITTEAK